MTLPEYIISKLNVPFEYGTNDCILFTIGWLELSTDKKYLPQEKWNNEKQALRIIKKLGGLENQFDKHLKQIEPNFAKDGDLTIVDGISYLFSGSNIVSVSKNGLIYRNRMLAKKAWCNG
jgi:hypothetical protein